MRSKQSGFTLVEIAIVLVIIGLLLGGVLKGQELINSAKIKGLANDLNGISAAVYGYQDRFKALPGDDPTAATRWGAATTSGDGNTGLAAGATLHAFNSATAAHETRLFWQHLRLAGFIGGDTTSTAQPLNSVGGITGVQFGAGSQAVGAGLPGLVVCQTNILGRIAESLDNQLDDGNPSGGSVKSWTQAGLVAADGATTGVDITVAGAVATAASYVDDGTTMYTVCKKVT